MKFAIYALWSSIWSNFVNILYVPEQMCILHIIRSIPSVAKLLLTGDVVTWQSPFGLAGKGYWQMWLFLLFNFLFKRNFQFFYLGLCIAIEQGHPNNRKCLHSTSQVQGASLNYLVPLPLSKIEIIIIFIIRVRKLRR